MPQAGVVRHEPRPVYLDRSYKAAGRFVTISALRFAPVYLRQGFKAEGWKRQPRRIDLRLLSDGEIQAANRQQVCGGAEPQVNIGAALDRNALCSVQTPSVLGIDG